MERRFSLRETFRGGVRGRFLPRWPEIAYWPGDGNANDDVGGHHGVLRSGATFAPGLVGQAFRLPQDGAQVEILFGNDDFNFVPIEPMTIEMWAKRTYPAGPLPSGLGMHLLGKRIRCDDAPFQYQMYNHGAVGGLGFGGTGGSGGAQAGLGFLLFDQWKHLAVTYDGTAFKFYVDGVLEGGPNFGHFRFPNDAPLLIGGSGGCSTFIGLIDEVKIYNRALSADEIRASYNLGLAGIAAPASPAVPSSDGLIGYWPGEDNAADAVGSSDGDMRQGATFGEGIVGRAFSFDGVNGYVDIPNNLPSSMDAITVEAWVNFASLKSKGIKGGLFADAIVVMHDWWVSKEVFVLRTTGSLPGLNRFEFAVMDGASNSGGIVRGPIPETNQWYHVVGTYDGSFVSLFLNGDLFREKAWSGSIPIDNRQPIWVVRDQTNEGRTDGRIDEVKIYNRALSAAEIKESYDAGSAGKSQP